jgi:carotenoid cleavage dioxygenase-like enzyme
MPVANPYLEGNFAPVAEEVTVTDLPVEGVLPEALSGRYLRNGPNPLAAVEPATYHWFTGEGMVHGIRLDGGQARWYRNRYVRSAEVAALLGEPWKSGPVVEGFDFAANTNVVAHAGKTFALVEAGARPYELDDELDTVGPSDFDGTLPGGYTAHPKRDPATGELHAISYYFGWGPQVQYTVTGVDGHVRRIVDIPVGGLVSVHDLSITESSVVIYDLPVVFSMEAVTQGSRFPYRWSDDYQPRVGVLPREGGPDDVVWCEVDPCYVFHPMNAYDEDGVIVVDVVRHPRMFATRHNGPFEGAPTLERWRIDPSSRKVSTELIDGRAQEFPRVDERTVGRRHRYGYAVALEGQAEAFTSDAALVKHDFERGTQERRAMPGPAGEAVFVPSSADADEDDGWVLGLVHDGDRGAADLVVLNAQDFTGEPAAVVHLPVRVPLGFHGNWAPDPA